MSDKYDNYDAALQRDLDDEVERALEDVEEGNVTIYMNDDEFFRSLAEDDTPHE